MAEIQFFEKPGCINNAKQKSWLTAAGHQVETELNPLGDVVELVRKMGLDVTYAYDDLAFIEHNAFIFRFDQGRNLSLYFNEDCPTEDANRLEQQIVGLGSKGYLTVKRKGRYSMTQVEGESNLEIRFIEDEL